MLSFALRNTDAKSPIIVIAIAGIKETKIIIREAKLNIDVSLIDVHDEDENPLSLLNKINIDITILIPQIDK